MALPELQPLDSSVLRAFLCAGLACLLVRVSTRLQLEEGGM